MSLDVRNIEGALAAGIYIKLLPKIPLASVKLCLVSSGECRTTNSLVDPSDPTFSRDLWFCEECGQVDTMSHVAVCAAYQPLREGKDINNDKHLAEYMAAVMKVRSRLWKK